MLFRFVGMYYKLQVTKILLHIHSVADIAKKLYVQLSATIVNVMGGQ